MYGYHISLDGWGVSILYALYEPFTAQFSRVTFDTRGDIVQGTSFDTRGGGTRFRSSRRAETASFDARSVSRGPTSGRVSHVYFTRHLGCYLLQRTIERRFVAKYADYSRQLVGLLEIAIGGSRRFHDASEVSSLDARGGTTTAQYRSVLSVDSRRFPTAADRPQSVRNRSASGSCQCSWACCSAGGI